MGPKLIELPFEILDAICSRIDHKSLADLRLTAPQLTCVAERHLFHTVTFNQTIVSVQRLVAIASHPRLSVCVHSLVFEATSDPDDQYPWCYQPQEGLFTLSAGYLEQMFISVFQQLPNLIEGLCLGTSDPPYHSVCPIQYSSFFSTWIPDSYPRPDTVIEHRTNRLIEILLHAWICAGKKFKDLKLLGIRPGALGQLQRSVTQPHRLLPSITPLESIQKIRKIALFLKPRDDDEELDNESVQQLNWFLALCPNLEALCLNMAQHIVISAQRELLPSIPCAKLKVLSLTNVVLDGTQFSVTLLHLRGTLENFCLSWCEIRRARWIDVLEKLRTFPNSSSPPQIVLRGCLKELEGRWHIGYQTRNNTPRLYDNFISYLRGDTDNRPLKLSTEPDAEEQWTEVKDYSMGWNPSQHAEG